MWRDPLVFLEPTLLVPHQSSRSFKVSTRKEMENWNGHDLLIKMIHFYNCVVLPFAGKIIKSFPIFLFIFSLIRATNSSWNVFHLKITRFFIIPYTLQLPLEVMPASSPKSLFHYPKISLPERHSFIRILFLGIFIVSFFNFYFLSLWNLIFWIIPSLNCYAGDDMFLDNFCVPLKRSERQMVMELMIETV